jgi:multidrug efflux pump
MKFTDIFVQKPVLASVVSLMIFLLGLRAADLLNVRQFPEMQNAVITVSTVYTGADADLMEGFVTTPLEQEIATADGIDYIKSSSVQGMSTIQAYVRLDYNANEVLTQIVSKVNKLSSELPDEALDPVVDLQVGQTVAAMYLSFSSDLLGNNEITDYLTRVVQPKLATVAGVQRAQILGARTFAMRAWLQPDRMAALNITPGDVYAALQQNNVLSAVGGSKGLMVGIDMSANTDLNSAQQFRRLAVRSSGDQIVRLEDVAEIKLGAENYDTSVVFDGKDATFMGIQVAPDANSLDVIADVRSTLEEEVRPQLPQGMELAIPYDSTDAIEDSINEVVKTIIEAVLIVILVIYLFLGSLRSVFIPAVAVPLSLVGALFLMLTMDFSINLLTLLAMVLAIGIVVDDAIIVLENIHRHIEEGLTPKDAALQGARELAWPVVAMTTTLVAVYLPIGFLGGLTGTLFTEFAFALAGAVLLSGVIALTLSPMLCSKLLKPHEDNGGNRFEAWLDDRFEKLRLGYLRWLHGAMNDKQVVAVFGGIVLVACYFLFTMSPQELEPQEDTGFVLAQAEADPYSTLEYLTSYTEQITKKGMAEKGVEHVFLLNGMGGPGSQATNQAIAGFPLEPWSEREVGTQDVQRKLQESLGQIAGLKMQVFIPPSLPSAGGGAPVQFVLGTTQPVETLKEPVEKIVQKARESQKFFFVDDDLKINKPRSRVMINREKAATLGISMDQLGRELGAMLSAGEANRFSLDNRSYKVIPQAQRLDRLKPEQIRDYQIRTGSGKLVPLSTLVTLKQEVEPQKLNRFQQLNAVTISGVPRPSVPLGEALNVLEKAADKEVPDDVARNYAGQSRQLVQESGGLILTFFFALIIIYLVLSAQFESFRDPIIMLVTVPMSIFGALVFVSLGQPLGLSINLYTQVGLVTLIGVISKHGILIVEFANKLQEQGYDKRKAIEEAASIRLRPVLMTTAALVLAMIPLITATGSGAAARFNIGVVIASGMTIGTAFTLFVVPAMYLYLGRDHQASAA